MLALRRLRSLFMQTTAVPAVRPTHRRFVPMLTAMDERVMLSVTVLSDTYSLGNGAATVGLTVTQADELHNGPYRWNYHVTNNAGSTNPDDYFKSPSTFLLYGNGIGPSDVTVFSSSNGWPGGFGLSYYNVPIFVWDNDRSPGYDHFLPTGASADFAFTTEPVTIVDVTADFGDGFTGDAIGTVKGPGVPKATTTSLAVDAIWPDTSPVPTGLFLTAFVSGDPQLGDPTGTVEFMDGDVSIGTAELVGNGNGTAITTLTASGLTLGTHPITAKYNGDAAHEVSTSAPSVVNYREVVSERVEEDSEEGHIGGEDGDGEPEGGEDGDDSGDSGGDDCAPPPAVPTSSTLTIGDYKHPNSARLQGATDVGFKATGMMVKFFGRNVDVDGSKAKAVSEAKYESINFVAPFKPETSYIIKPLINDEVLFRHERLHLAIGEFMAQMAKDNFPTGMVGKGKFEGNVTGADAQERADNLAQRDLDDKREAWRKQFEAVIQEFVRKYDADTMSGRGPDQVNWETGNGYQAKALEFLKSKGYDK